MRHGAHKSSRQSRQNFVRRIETPTSGALRYQGAIEIHGDIVVSAVVSSQCYSLLNCARGNHKLQLVVVSAYGNVTCAASGGRRDPFGWSGIDIPIRVYRSQKNCRVAVDCPVVSANRAEVKGVGSAEAL